jgi:NADPH-dependent ferric siderophore reductase
VVEVVDASATMRRIEFDGRRLRGIRWNPGDKVQVRIEGFTNRTYTPTSWDPNEGRATILASKLGDGPGRAWTADLRPGDSAQLFGPRASVDLRGIEDEPLFVGDETCYGLALSWRNAIQRDAAYCFEAQDPDDARTLLRNVGLRDAIVVAAEPSSDPLVGAVTAHLAEHANTTVVIAGRAQSIRRVRGAIRDAGDHTGEARVKAYWDENRAGLD